jgi:nucleoside-diphosphate-sugar epimerase
MHVFVTGGAGFIGRRVVARLLDRGDSVVCPVREPARARELAAAGAELVQSDLSDAPALESQMRGCDGVVHIAGSYRVGIRPDERPAMWDANVGATERVLDAAIAAGVPRIVYISTNNIFGDTHGAVVDESFRRDLATGFLSWYDETKYRAHEAAAERIARGAPVIIAQPGGVYGPNDHSEAGGQVRQAFEGSLPYRALDDAGLAWVHVDDLAAGIVAALDRGRIGESYVLAGPPARLGEAMEIAARLGGRRLPRLRIPTRLLRTLAPVASRLPRRLTALMGFPPNLAEVVRAGDRVTYWASSGKAERELGFRARDLEAGLRDTFGAG